MGRCSGGNPFERSSVWLVVGSGNVDEMTAITDGAHKFGKLTAAHCVSSQGVANSLEAEVDMIIHCHFRDPDGDHHFREDIADRIAEQGAYVNPTLQVGRTAAWTLAHKRDAEGLIPSERELLDQALLKLELHLDDTRRMIEM